MTPLLVTSEVAELLRVPEATLRYWRHVNYGPRSVRIGRRHLFREADVEAWVDEQFATPDAAEAPEAPDDTTPPEDEEPT